MLVFMLKNKFFSNFYAKKIKYVNIFFITLFFFVFIGVAYLALTTPTYKASSYVREPMLKDIQELNKKDFEQKIESDKEITSAVVFERFLSNFQSIGVQQNFYYKNELCRIYDNDNKNCVKHFEVQFSPALIIEKKSKIDPKSYLVLTFELQYENPYFVSKILNDYVDFVIEITKNELSEEVVQDAKNQAFLINEQIISKRGMALQRREDRIRSLEENIIIAKNIGIEKAQINQSDNKLNMEYNRGYLALEAELEVLKKRESDEPFIEGLRILQERVFFLNNIDINLDKISVVRIDQSAIEPYEAIKPNKKITIFLFLLSGLFLFYFTLLVKKMLLMRLN